jgi:hypothetical protein
MDRNRSKKRKFVDIDGAKAANTSSASKKSKDVAPPTQVDDDGASDLEGSMDAPMDGSPPQSGLIVPSTAETNLFEDLGLSEKTLKALKEDMGFTTMTEIQAKVRDLD